MIARNCPYLATEKGVNFEKQDSQVGKFWVGKIVKEGHNVLRPLKLLPEPDYVLIVAFSYSSSR